MRTTPTAKHRALAVKITQPPWDIIEVAVAIAESEAEATAELQQQIAWLKTQVQTLEQKNRTLRLINKQWSDNAT